MGMSEAGSHGAGPALNITGGAISGGVTVDDGGTASFSGAGSGTYTFVGTSSAATTALSGTIASGQTVVLRAGAGVGGVQMDANADVTNNGTLEFTDPDASGAGQQTVRLHMDPGTLINNGTFIADRGGGGDGLMRSTETRPMPRRARSTSTRRSRSIRRQTRPSTSRAPGR